MLFLFLSLSNNVIKKNELEEMRIRIVIKKNETIEFWGWIWSLQFLKSETVWTNGVDTLEQVWTPSYLVKMAEKQSARLLGSEPPT